MTELRSLIVFLDHKYSAKSTNSNNSDSEDPIFKQQQFLMLINTDKVIGDHSAF